MTKKTTTHYYPDLTVFKEILGRGAHETILAMDAAGDDIAMQEPAVNLIIDQVGCKSKKTYITLNDPLSKGECINLFASIDIGIELSKTERGIHVSRLTDSIARLATEKTYNSLCDFAHALAIDVKETQKAQSVTVKIKTDYISHAEVETVHDTKQKKTQDYFLLLAETTVGNKNQKTGFGIEFNHMTSCPCVQQTLQHASGNKFQQLAHSHRVITRVFLTPVDNDIQLADLLRSIDSILVLTRDTLPRPGEAALVFRSHEHPMFIEDVVRLLAHQLYVDFGKKYPEANIIINSRSLESIHTFDMVAKLRTSMKELHDVHVSTRDHNLSKRKVKSRWNATDETL